MIQVEILRGLIGLLLLLVDSLELSRLAVFEVNPSHVEGHRNLCLSEGLWVHLSHAVRDIQLIRAQSVEWDLGLTRILPVEDLGTVVEVVDLDLALGHQTFASNFLLLARNLFTSTKLLLD